MSETLSSRTLSSKQEEIIRVIDPLLESFIFLLCTSFRSTFSPRILDSLSLLAISKKSENLSAFSFNAPESGTSPKNDSRFIRLMIASSLATLEAFRVELTILRRGESSVSLNSKSMSSDVMFDARSSNDTTHVLFGWCWLTSILSSQSSVELHMTLMTGFIIPPISNPASERLNLISSKFAMMSKVPLYRVFVEFVNEFGESSATRDVHPNVLEERRQYSSTETHS